MMAISASGSGNSAEPLVLKAVHRRQGARLAPWQIKLAQFEMVQRLRARFRVEDIADRLQVSTTHFTKAFKNSVGITPYDWFQRARISQSMRLMEDSSLTLAEIASECGFTDESHFSASFSRIVGARPGRWRRHKREQSMDDSLDNRLLALAAVASARSRS